MDFHRGPHPLHGPTSHHKAQKKTKKKQILSTKLFDQISPMKPSLLALNVGVFSL